jgi:hypothetical protein
MTTTLLQVQPDSVVIETIANNGTTSIWFWVALVEFALIVLLLFRVKKKVADLKFGDLSKDNLRTAKKTDVDMNDVMNSINSSKGLYKELSRTCHPDRFINSDKQKIAEEIFQEISRNKRNFKKLTELKERATTELNINFK